MIPGINPQMMKQAMKKMGIKQEEIEAEEVIIKCSDKELVVRNPSVQKINMMGQESFQISGEIEERSLEKYKESDVKLVIEQTGKSENLVRKKLEENDGDIAKTILDLEDDNV